jgi:hypothetical protein
VQSFITKHASWWEKDAEATAWAVTRAGELAAQNLSPARQLQIVERELGQYFPEYAPQPERPKAKAVSLSQPGTRASSPRGKTFADMPKEAQDAAAYFEKKGVSRDDYVREYFAGQG